MSGDDERRVVPNSSEGCARGRRRAVSDCPPAHHRPAAAENSFARHQHAPGPSGLFPGSSWPVLVLSGPLHSALPLCLLALFPSWRSGSSPIGSHVARHVTTTHRRPQIQGGGPAALVVLVSSINRSLWSGRLPFPAASMPITSPLHKAMSTKASSLASPLLLSSGPSSYVNSA